MLIGICEADEEFRSREALICKRLFERYSIKCKIKLFSEGSKILKDSDEYNLILTDTVFENSSGIEIKNSLQDKGKDTKIIFVSNHSEHMAKAFGLNVVGFIFKKNIETQLFKTLNMLYKNGAHTMINGELDSRDVVYVKSEGVYNVFMMKNGNQVLIRETLARCEEELEEFDFIRIHKSYIVNARYITALGNKEIHIGETSLPVSVRMYGDVKKKYRRFCMVNKI